MDARPELEHLVDEQIPAFPDFDRADEDRNFVESQEEAGDASFWPFDQWDSAATNDCRPARTFSPKAPRATSATMTTRKRPTRIAIQRATGRGALAVAFAPERRLDAFPFSELDTRNYSGRGSAGASAMLRPIVPRSRLS